MVDMSFQASIRTQDDLEKVFDAIRLIVEQNEVAHVVIANKTKAVRRTTPMQVVPLGQRVLRILKDNKAPMTASLLSNKLRCNHEEVRAELERLKLEGLAHCSKGRVYRGKRIDKWSAT